MKPLLIAAGAILLAAPAFAQLPLGRGQFEPDPNNRGEYRPHPDPSAPPGAPNPCTSTGTSLDKASKPFVEQINAASEALKLRDATGALGAAALARPHAASQRQTAAVIQIEIAAYHELGNQTALTQKLETALTDICLPSEIRENYSQMLAKLRAGGQAPRQP